MSVTRFVAKAVMLAAVPTALASAPADGVPATELSSFQPC